MRQTPAAEGHAAEDLFARDADARERALDLDRSCIVQAPAGSGKTGLLVQRVLALLTRVERPEAVLAITFTRKAQAEMRQRILAALTEAVAATPVAGAHAELTRALALEVLERDAALGWNLRDEPQRLGILTIDAFNQRLVRRLPLTSGLGCSPETTEDAASLNAAAATLVLQQLDAGDTAPEALQTLLAHLDNDGPHLHQLLVDMLAGRDRWQRHVAGAGELDRSRLEAALLREVTGSLKRLCRLWLQPLAMGLLRHGRHAASNLLAEARDSPITALCELSGLPGATVDDLAVWQGVAELTLTQTGEWRRSLTIKQGFPPGKGRDKEQNAAAKQAALEWVNALAEVEGLRKALQRVRQLPATVYPDEQWQVLSALMQVLRLALAALRVVSLEQGKVDFSTVADAARAALGSEDEPTDLALALDSRIEHVLVDEFQDTSYSQHALLSRLVAGWLPGDGRTLFLVGDPMQSIYAFRAAEVGLFLQVWESGELGPVQLERLQLSRNFRSLPGVVAWVNRAFARLLPTTADVATGAIAHAPSVAARAGEGGRVELHPAEDAAVEAAAAVELVRQAQQQNPTGSIAVLGQTRGHLRPVMQALKAAGLAPQAVDLEPIGQRPMIRDLLALSRALAHPGDRLAWFSVLRAPWCGLNLASLARLDAGDDTTPLPWRAADPEFQAGLDAGMRARLDRCLPVLTAAGLDWHDEAPFARRLEQCWLALGGPACVTSADELATAERFFELLAQLAPVGTTAELDLVEAHTTRLMAGVDPAANHRLQVLTMHKAKGLEFDTVLLVGLGQGRRNDQKPLLHLVARPRDGGEQELLLGPIEVDPSADRLNRYLAQIEKDRQAEETLRLLYVAATRARESLHLLGRVKAAGEKQAEPEPRKGSLLDRLWPVVGADYVAAMNASSTGVPVSAAAPDFAAAESPRIWRLAADWQWPALPEPVVKPLPTPTVPAPAPTLTPVFEWAGRTARAIGIVVHAVLQAMAEDGLAQWSEARVRAQTHHYRSQLALSGVEAAELPMALQRVTGALIRTLDDPRGRWCLSPHVEARSEWSLAGQVDGQVVRGIIDRLVRTEDRVWIIDFKTSSHGGGGLDQFLDAEVERYRDQLERYARLVRLQYALPVSLGLYFPLIGGWREWSAPTPVGAG